MAIKKELTVAEAGRRGGKGCSEAKYKAVTATLNKFREEVKAGLKPKPKAGRKPTYMVRVNGKKMSVPEAAGLFGIEPEAIHDYARRNDISRQRAVNHWAKENAGP